MSKKVVRFARVAVGAVGIAVVVVGAIGVGVVVVVVVVVIGIGSCVTSVDTEADRNMLVVN